jgi:hypothetical protein
VQHAIAVAHPDDALGATREIREQRVLPLLLQPGAPVLAIFAALDHAAEVAHQQLHAVADAEHRPAELQDRRLEGRRVRIEHAGRSAGEHDAGRIPGLDRRRAEIRRMDLAVDAQLAQPARDQLGELGAIVENEDAVALGARGRFHATRSDSWELPW